MLFPYALRIDLFLKPNLISEQPIFRAKFNFQSSSFPCPIEFYSNTHRGLVSAGPNQKIVIGVNCSIEKEVHGILDNYLWGPLPYEKGIKSTIRNLLVGILYPTNLFQSH